MTKEIIKKLTDLELITRIKNKDKDNNFEKEELINRNINFLRKLSHRYYNKFLSFDDIMQEAIIGFLEAINNFDLSKNIKFITFAYYYVIRRLSRAIWRAGDGGIHMANYTYLDKIKLHKLNHGQGLDMRRTCFNVSDSNVFENVFGNYILSYMDTDKLSHKLSIEKLYSYLTTEEKEFMDKKFGLHGERLYIGWELCELYDRSDTHLQSYYNNIIKKLQNISTGEGLDKF